MSKTLHIGFISTRIAGTDGVSLEIAKWAAVLGQMGHKCFYFAGELDRASDRCFRCGLAHFNHPRIIEITRRSFGAAAGSEPIHEMIRDCAHDLKKSLREFIASFAIDVLIPENALTIPMNIPLGIAAVDIIAEHSLPAIAHHHDFYWERQRYDQTSAGDYLRRAFPPVHPCIRHVVINSLAQQSLYTRLGLESVIVPNVYDFDRAPVAGMPETARRLRRHIGFDGDEPFFLQPTRVVPRKGIELSIDLVRALCGNNGRLVISHASGDEGDAYRDSILKYAGTTGVDLVFIDDVIVSHEGGALNEFSCTLDDAYRAADFVLYPSLYEGFGNAFLETVYHKKPVMINRYPVFVSDIEPLGFKSVAIDGSVTEKAVHDVKRILEDDDCRTDMVETNYMTALKHFSSRTLKELLGSVIHSLDL